MYNQEILTVCGEDGATTDSKRAALKVDTGSRDIVSMDATGYETFHTSTLPLNGAELMVWYGDTLAANLELIKPLIEGADVYTITGAKGTGEAILHKGELLMVIPNQKNVMVDPSLIQDTMHDAGIAPDADPHQGWNKAIGTYMFLNDLLAEARLPKVDISDIQVVSFLSFIAGQVSGRASEPLLSSINAEEFKGFAGKRLDQNEIIGCESVDRVMRAAGFGSDQYFVTEDTMTSDKRVQIAGDYTIALTMYEKFRRLRYFEHEKEWLCELDSVFKGAIHSDTKRDYLPNFALNHAYMIERRGAALNRDVIFGLKMVDLSKGGDKYQHADDAAGRGITSLTQQRRFFYFPYATNRSLGMFWDAEKGEIPIGRIQHLQRNERDGFIAAVYYGMFENFFGQLHLLDPVRNFLVHGGATDLDSQMHKRYIADGVARAMGVDFRIMKAGNPAIFQTKMGAEVFLGSAVNDTEPVQIIDVHNPFDFSSYRKEWLEKRARLVYQ